MTRPYVCAGIVSRSWGLGGCAALGAGAVAETPRLGDPPYYVELVQPQPQPGSCARVLPAAQGIQPAYGFPLLASEAPGP
jgi:hypothetical protein